MARARTLLQLRTEVRTLTDTVGDDHVSDAQLLVWINQGIAELWRDLVATRADRYAVQGTTIATTSGTYEYDLEDDFMSMWVIWRTISGERIPLEEHDPREALRRFPNPSISSGWALTYRVQYGGIDGTGTQIRFEPNPGTNSYDYYYIQAPQSLAADGDSFDGIAGYEDWVVLYTALRVFIRQQDPDQAGIAAEMARIKGSIMASSAHRDVGHAPRIADTRARRALR
jgi:hypothetical protein